MNQHAGNPRRSWHRAIGARLRRPLHGGTPHPQIELVVLTLAWIGGIALAGTALLSGGAHVALSWPVLMFAALCIAGDSLLIRYSDTMQAACSDVFVAAAIVALPLHSAAMVVLLISLWTALFFADNLHETLGGGAFIVLAQAVAIWAVHGLGGVIQSRPVLLLLGVTLVIACLRITEMALFWTIGFANGLRGRTLKLRVRSAGERVAEAWEGVVHQFLAQAPMAALGAIAFAVFRWSIALLIVPMVMAWRSERQAAELVEARRKADIDSLTGLQNRSGLFRRAEIEIGAAATYGHPVALIMGDLDNFKRVNDTLGHLVGDEVLKATADALRRVVTAQRHAVGRYGGEEFVVLAVASSVDEARALAESVRAEVETALREYHSSISLGIAYLQEGDRLESLVDRADKALYSAKFAGKNRVHEFPANMQRPIAMQRAA